MKQMNAVRMVGLVLVVAAPMLLGQSVQQPAKAQAKTKTDTTKSEQQMKPEADQSQYVGSEECATCHDDQVKSLHGSPHRNILQLNDKTKNWGCESCHGPGKAHVESGGDIDKIFGFKGKTAAKQAERCLQCHSFNAEQSHFRTSVHSRNDVSCVTCHSVHQPKTEKALLKKPQPELCYTCHLEAKADFNKPFGHRIGQGLIKCSDCHNPHGTTIDKQLRTTAGQDAVCFNCHADKAGPFVFEHAPVKAEGCASCHTPHASTNPKLLRRSNVNLLCLECHSFAPDSAAPLSPSFHNQAQKYQACTMCHTQIHGSNFSDVFFK